MEYTLTSGSTQQEAPLHRCVLNRVLPNTHVCTAERLFISICDPNSSSLYLCLPSRAPIQGAEQQGKTWKKEPFRTE